MAEMNMTAAWPGWETVRVIGRGSFGAVYEIERDMLGEKEKAALKVITIPQSSSDIEELYGEGYDDESITSTFKEHLKNIIAEYSLMRKLNGCTNVVNCDDVRYVQHDDGIGWDIFIKMELLTPLTKALGREVPEEQAARIGADICRALMLCKRHNIIHRDIKPANIFVSENGDYKLGDFGIAKTVEKTSGGTKIGTYEYMAPEVYHDRPYGSAADIYSLGMVLYWLLNERRTPFLQLPPTMPTSTEKEKARRRRFSGEAIPAPAHGSAELKRIVLKACAYDPAERYESAEEMLRELEALNRPAFVPTPAPVSLPVTEQGSGEEGTTGAFRVGVAATAPAGPIREEERPEEEGTAGAPPPAEPEREEEKPFVPQPEYEREGTVGAWFGAPADPSAAEQTSGEEGTTGAFRVGAHAETVTEQAPEEEGTTGAWFGASAPQEDEEGTVSALHREKAESEKAEPAAAGPGAAQIIEEKKEAAAALAAKKAAVTAPEQGQTPPPPPAEKKIKWPVAVGVLAAILVLVVALIPKGGNSGGASPSYDSGSAGSGYSAPSGSQHVHVWTAVSCTEPSRCSVCGEVGTLAPGHDWYRATYDVPQVCLRCGETVGAVKGYIGTLYGNWSDETVSIGNNRTHAFELLQPVKNCFRLILSLTVTEYKGSPAGNWYLYGRDLNGKWTKIGDFTIRKEDLDGTIRIPFTFDPAVSFDALTIIRKGTNGFNISYGMGFYNAQCFEGSDTSKALPKWGVIGDFNDWGAKGGDLPMSWADTGIYESKPIKLAAGEELKVRENGSWDINYGPDGFNGSNLRVDTAGEYIVCLDMNRGVIMLIAA